MAERPAERFDGRPEQVDPALSAAGRHALHDEELIAAYAVDGDAADDPARARALIERCTTCRDLHADLVAIGGTIRAQATARAGSAPRDYRLTASDAVRLRGGSTLQRWAALFLDGLATFGRPVGASLATLGIVGVMVGALTLGQLGLVSTNVGPTVAGPTADSAPTPPSGPAAAGGGPRATVEMAVNQSRESAATGQVDFGPIATARDDGSTKATQPTDAAGGDSSPLVLLAASTLLLVIGIAFVVGGARQRRRMPARH